jgi:hypothetical protein
VAKIPQIVSTQPPPQPPPPTMATDVDDRKRPRAGEPRHDTDINMQIDGAVGRETHVTIASIPLKPVGTPQSKESDEDYCVLKMPMNSAKCNPRVREELDKLVKGMTLVAVHASWLAQMTFLRSI